MPKSQRWGGGGVRGQAPSCSFLREARGQKFPSLTKIVLMFVSRCGITENSPRIKSRGLNFSARFAHLWPSHTCGLRSPMVFSIHSFLFGPLLYYCFGVSDSAPHIAHGLSIKGLTVILMSKTLIQLLENNKVEYVSYKIPVHYYKS